MQALSERRIPADRLPSNWETMQKKQRTRWAKRMRRNGDLDVTPRVTFKETITQEPLTMGEAQAISRSSAEGRSEPPQKTPAVPPGGVDNRRTERGDSPHPLRGVLKPSSNSPPLVTTAPVMKPPEMSPPRDAKGQFESQQRPSSGQRSEQGGGKDRNIREEGASWRSSDHQQGSGNGRDRGEKGGKGKGKMRGKSGKNTAKGSFR